MPSNEERDMLELLLSTLMGKESSDLPSLLGSVGIRGAGVDSDQKPSQEQSPLVVQLLQANSTESSGASRRTSDANADVSPIGRRDIAELIALLTPAGQSKPTAPESTRASAESESSDGGSVG